MLIKERAIINTSSDMKINTNKKSRSSVGMKRPEESTVTNVSGDMNNRVKS